MNNMGRIKILIAALVLASLAGTGTAVSLTNSGGGNWQNYMDITIKEKSGSTLTDYQASVQMSGGNFPANARSDGADIRFTDANGTELGYWIENWDYSGRNARIWVKVPGIPVNGEAKLVMYYGNPSATSASNGGATFEFFDDFEGTGIDGTKWYINNGAPQVSDGVLSLSGECAVSEKIRAFGYNYIFESLSKISDTGNEPRSFLRATKDSAILDANDRFEFGSWANRNEMSLVTVENGIFNINSYQEKFPTSFEVLGMVRLNTKTEAFRRYISKSTSKKMPDKPLYLQLYSWGGETHYIDWVRVRKYASSDPALIFGAYVSSKPELANVQKNASVELHGEKTDVVLGEDVLLKLSAVNIIGNPIMHVQAIIIPPNGWSVTSSEFSMTGAGQYTTIYDLKPEDGSRDIEVKIMPNQVGDNFEVKGRIIYYFGDDLSTREDYTLSMPIKVRPESKDTPNPAIQPTKSAGFGFVITFGSVLLVCYLRIRKWK